MERFAGLSSSRVRGNTTQTYGRSEKDKFPQAVNSWGANSCEQFAVKESVRCEKGVRLECVSLGACSVKNL